MKADSIKQFNHIIEHIDNYMFPHCSDWPLPMLVAKVKTDFPDGAVKEQFLKIVGEVYGH